MFPALRWVLIWVQVVFCPNKPRYFEPFMCLDLSSGVHSRVILFKYSRSGCRVYWIRLDNGEITVLRDIRNGVCGRVSRFGI